MDTNANETEQPPSHIYLADLAVIRHPFSAGDPQCLDTTKAHTDQCPNQIDSLGIILFLDYSGDGAKGHPVGPEVLCHTKGGQSHQGYADPLDHKIKQGFTLPVVREAAADSSPPPFFFFLCLVFVFCVVVL